MATWIWFLILGVLFFLMMRGGCGAHVMGHGHGDHEDGHLKPVPGGQPLAAAASGSAIDPVCGMHVDPALAKSSVYRGEVYFFCSTEHRDTFEANPNPYLRTGSVTTSGEQHAHG